MRRGRAGGAAGRLGLLRRRRDRRRPPPPHPLLDHRPQGPGRHRGHRRDSRGCVDADPLPAGGLRRATRQWVSDAEVAEVPFTAFAPETEGPAGRGAVDRAPGARRQPRPRQRSTPRASCSGSGATTPMFTDSPLPMLAAEADHRRHAIIEQVIADLKNSALAHLPSGQLRRELRLAGARRDRVQPHPRRRRARLELPRQSHHRDPAPQLINVAARVTRSARRITLRLPAAWPWAAAWQRLFTAATGPPARA